MITFNDGDIKDIHRRLQVVELALEYMGGDAQEAMREAEKEIKPLREADEASQ